MRLRRAWLTRCFGGEYNETFSAGRSGVFEEGVVRVHLRRWLEDQDAWTLARYMCSPVMQREAARTYKDIAPANRGAQFIERAEGVCAWVNATIFKQDVTLPRLTDHSKRSVFTELLHLPQAQIIKRLDDGLPAGVCAESDVFEHCG